MQYLGDYRIDDYITFGAQLHRFSSGAVYAPTGNVTYTFYENNSTSGAPTGGNLAQLNSKTGLYTARVQLTAANGFEVGKEYLIHIEATVDSVAAGELLMFRTVGNPKVDVDTIKTQTVTCAAGVTVLASVGTAATSTAQTGDAFARLGAPAGASVSADVAAVKSDTGAILADTGTDGVVVAAGSKTGYSLTATTGLGNQTANITGNLSGSVGSVTGAVGSVTGAVGSVIGAVGSVTGNVGGNVVGSVGSVMGHTPQTGDAFARLGVPIGASVSADIAAVKSDTAAILVDTGTTLDTLIQDIPTTAEFQARTLPAADYTVVSDLPSVPTAAAVADAVWDEALSGHAVAGSAGAALSAAGTAGDPWSTALPGAYGAGTAGKLLSDIEAVAPDNKPTVAATGEASANVTLWKGATAPDAPPTAAAVAYAVWSENMADHLGPTTAGGRLNLAAQAGPVGDLIEAVGYNRFKTTALENMRPAVGLATANLDAQLAGLPTAADVQSAAAAALEAYDPPTMAELTSAVAPLALEATAQAVLLDTGTTLPTAIAAIEPGGGSCAGDGTGYYSDTIDDGTSPLDGVRVQLYTSPNRVGPAYEAYTNALGVFEMWPDPGTYYRWLDLAGYNFSQDVAVTVTEP